MVATILLLAAAAAGDPAEFFESRVRPLLAKNCYACHTESRLGGLRLDSRESLLKGGNSGPAVRPGKPEESLLIQAVTRTHERLKMPPPGKLADQEIADLFAWVKAGAVWPEARGASAPAPAIQPEQRAFWSFQPVRKPAVPVARDPIWPRTAIDRFILAKLEERGVRPAAAADKRTLIRRATFDLVGLPPAPEEVEAFVADASPEAFARVADRLLASPRYGERWGRYWLDLARYADGKLGAFADTPAPNAFRYRDWVIRAFNDDMPYDRFVKAQIAGDLMGSEPAIAGLGFQALGRNADDQVDVTSRVFLGLTVACAQCHDHKYDPIPTKDYYSLLGVFRSSEMYEHPLAPEAEVEAYKKQEKNIEELKDSIDEFLRKQNGLLSDILARKTARYMAAAWRGTAAEAGLDAAILEKWVKYLKDPEKEHPYLKPWFEAVARGASREEIEKLAGEVEAQLLAIIAEKKEIDDRNYVTLGGAKGVKDEQKRTVTALEFLHVDKYYLWRDLCSEPYRRNVAGIYYQGEKEIGRFLHPEWKEYLEAKRAEHDALKKSLPAQYPFLHALREGKNPKNVRVAIRGEARNLGEEAPRRFLTILAEGEPKPFTRGSGRLELAEAIASPSNPLTARVMVNRVWEQHFGHGIVRSPANFGQLGERPTHPELLDYLAARFVEGGWSIKKLHREILLSSAYQMSVAHSVENFERDPENRLLWRANLRPRLDAEALRDTLLAVAGKLDLAAGGPAVALDEKNTRRTVYAYVSRFKPDAMLQLFDFPDPNVSNEQRSLTEGPLQRLFFLNSDFIAQRAREFAERLAREVEGDDEARVRRAYLLLYARPATPKEVELGLEFLREAGQGWARYAQVLLSSNEFSSVN